MEFLTILLSSLLGLVTPAGLVIDRTAENAIRSQFTKVGQLQVRVDNAPTHQLLQGKVEKVRIAGRELQLRGQEARIAVLELETDKIELDLRFRRLPKLKLPKLKRPLQAGVRLVLTEQDVNKLLQSPQVIARLQKLNLNLIDSLNTNSSPVYNFTKPQVEFLANNRLRLQVELRENGKRKPLLIKVESGLNLLAGRQIQLLEPVAAINGEQVPPQFLDVIVNNLNQRLDLRNLEGGGLQARILKLEMKPAQLEIAAFFRIKPNSRFWKLPAGQNRR